jgi:hypothetical protein
VGDNGKALISGTVDDDTPFGSPGLWIWNGGELIYLGIRNGPVPGMPHKTWAGIAAAMNSKGRAVVIGAQEAFTADRVVGTVSDAYEDYCECCGELDLEDWRRMNVDTLIRRTSEEVHAAKPWVKFGVSPFGIYRNDEPEGVKGLDQYTTLYSDPKKWLEKGWVDYIAPQLYWKSSSKYRPYEKLLNWWGEQNALRRHIYAGISLASIERRNGNWSVAEFEKQFNYSREASHRQSLGSR